MEVVDYEEYLIEFLRIKYHFYDVPEDPIEILGDIKGERTDEQLAGEEVKQNNFLLNDSLLTKRDDTLSKIELENLLKKNYLLNLKLMIYSKLLFGVKQDIEVTGVLEVLL